MHDDSHIALLLLTWISIGLATFTALDAATHLPGGLTITKRRNQHIACAVVLGIGLWSGLWLGQFGLHRQVGVAVSAPIVATLMTTPAVSLAASSIVLPEASISNGALAPQRRSIAIGAVTLGIGPLTTELYLTRPWVYDQTLSLRRAVLGWGGGTLVSGTGVCLAMCVASHVPPIQRRIAVGLRVRAVAVLATTAVLSLVLWPCAAAWSADESTMHTVPITVLGAGGVLIALGLYVVLMILETRVDSAQARLKASLARMANQTPRPQLHDALTGLPNRLYLREVLETTILSSTRCGHPFVLFYLDLDNFGQINDQYGRNAGGRMLQITAERLRQAIYGEDTVACLGGDEPGILAEDLVLLEATATIDDKLLFRLRESVEVEGRHLRATTSVDVVVHPRNGATADTLPEHVDTAMFDCKQSADNVYHFLEPCLNTTVHCVLRIQRALSHTALNEQLSTYYQPKCDARTQITTGAETLLRWNHPELGPVSSVELIPLAERTGIIAGLGGWVAEEACRQIMHWDTIGMAPQRIVVSLPPRQFQQPDPVQHLSQIPHRYQVVAHRLMFEVTETAAMHDVNQSIAVIRQIQPLGFEVATDDSRTGYSSLSYLQRFRAQQIKINRTLISTLDGNPPEVATIIHAICATTHSLDIIVMAESAETEARMQTLVNLRCDQAQGYLLTRPTPAKDF